jgi:dTDP-4-amino-4,6-dideoxygalactose transaminase
VTDTIPLGSPTFGEEELEAVRSVLASGWVAGQGPANRSLEEAWCRLTGAPHSIAVANCTAGLHLALLSLGVGPGDEVIVADYTYPATGHSVAYTGATPMFCDVDPRTWCIDPAVAESLIGPRTVGIIAVDVAGQCAELLTLRELARRKGIFLVEDAACSAGATHHGRPSGHPDLSDIAAFSLHARKGITSGEGGVVTTADDDHAARIRGASCFGVESALSREGSDELPIPSFTTLGYNYKLSDIAAAIAEVQLSKLDELLAARRHAAARYDEAFADDELVVTPLVGAGNTHTYQGYLLTLDPSVDRGAVAMRLRSLGIGANIGTYASHLQPVYGETQACPVSADVFRRHLAIPMSANLTDPQIERVVDAVRSAVVAERH